MTSRTAEQEDHRKRTHRLLVFGLGFILVGVVTTLLLAFVWPLVAPVHMQVIAHRGILTDWPEDSFQAIAAVPSSSAEGVEFDVNRSADGTWWLIHDDTLDALTTGTGSPWDLTDAQLSELTFDGGMGYNPARHAGLVRLARMTDVLDVLASYPGIVIVDCKDARPGAHRALGEELSVRGMVGPVIARTAAGASELKAADSRFRTIMVANQVMNPDVDAWIATAGNISLGASTFADLMGDLGMYVGSNHWPDDEWPLLDDGRRHGVAFVISNDVAGALAWRAATETRGAIAARP